MREVSKAEKSLSFEERLFDFVFKDVPMNRIYIQEWEDLPRSSRDSGQNELCDVCIENGLRVPNYLAVYSSTSYTENNYLSIPHSRLWKFRASIHTEFHRDIFLTDFYKHSVASIKQSIGSSILQLVERYIVVKRAKWLEIWQHQVVSDKPLFRCTSLEQLLIEMDLHGGGADGHRQI